MATNNGYLLSVDVSDSQNIVFTELNNSSHYHRGMTIDGDGNVWANGNEQDRQLYQYDTSNWTFSQAVSDMTDQEGNIQAAFGMGYNCADGNIYMSYIDGSHGR